jgi:hypothetical protein
MCYYELYFTRKYLGTTELALDIIGLCSHIGLDVKCCIIDDY